jgi:pimeloyl-ACP methyl ester carboxylesterase
MTTTKTVTLPPNGMHPSFTRQELRTHTAPALEVIIYRPAGDGPLCATTCMLVHGACHSAACFDVWGGELATMGVTTYVLSLRGHGASDPAHQPRMADYVVDVRHTYDALHLDPARSVLVGHSLGGFVVQFFARRWAVAGLVLLASVGVQRATASLPQIAHSLGVSPLRLVNRNAVSMFDAPDKVRRTLLEADADDATVAGVIQQLCPESQRAMQPLFGAMVRRVLPMPRLRTPRVLVLAGEQDGCFRQRDIRASARRLGRRVQTQMTLIPGGPHDLMLAHEPASRAGVTALAQFCYSAAPIEPPPNSEVEQE